MQTVTILNQIRSKYGKNSNEYALASNVFDREYNVDRVLKNILKYGAGGAF